MWTLIFTAGELDIADSKIWADNSLVISKVRLGVTDHPLR